MITEQQRDQNRQELILAIVECTSPAATGKFHWDGFEWQSKNRLMLYGDHGTSDFQITFTGNGQVEIRILSLTPSIDTLLVNYGDIWDMAKKIVFRCIEMHRYSA
jgi:hypothetical protein